MAIAVEAATRGRSILWGAPTYDQVRVGWGETKRAATGVATFNQSAMTCTFPSGGTILYRSLDNPDHARGHTAGGIVIDESADVSEAAYHEVLRPMLIDTGGWLWAIGTPKGRNWFWREFVMAAERGDSAAWDAPTIGCEIRDDRLVRVPHPLENPEVPFAEIEHLHRTLPERVFRQEVLSEFIEESGGVFRGISECIDRGRVQPTEPSKDRKYCLGVDLARVEDFTVLTVLDDTGKQVYFERFNQISWERQVARIKAVSARYGGLVLLDSTGLGDPIFERLRKDGVKVIGFTFTNASKENLIDGLALRIEHGEVRLMDVPEQANELMAYEYEITPSRNVRMNAPEGMHDDCVIALALANHGARNLIRGVAKGY
jgi:phage FluMu gp28-like protein